MIKAAAKSASKAIGYGRIRYYESASYEVSESKAEDPKAETDRFILAVQKAIETKHENYDNAVKNDCGRDAEIFQAHEMLLRDEELIRPIRERIENKQVQAPFAVKSVLDEMTATFFAMQDEELRERGEDLIDIKLTLLNILLNVKKETVEDLSCCILSAKNLTPSDIVSLPLRGAAGILLKAGSVNSHTAILARSMNIPMLVECKKLDRDWDGKEAVIDGIDALVYVEPDEETRNTYLNKIAELAKQKELLSELKGKENVTLDGRRLRIMANIGSPRDIESVKENDAGGIGLFRTEFIYLEKHTDPSEAEQYKQYVEVAKQMYPLDVVIRSCDIGADKTADYLKLEHEENPAMGYRAIRLCLSREDFFKRQLRAILRASVVGNVRLLIPMITSVKELDKALAILVDCRKELESEGIETGPLPVGVMIETPAAALCADELAAKCSFFSIGTNDLTQYTLAIDRQNARLEPFFDPHHPAVLRQIQMTVEAAKKAGIFVGICGELGADPELTETFLRMGIDAISVTPS
nr:phosphoenolpyruvate--protein phosphotransferase [Lachnospiraceae bacterium]